MKVSEHKKAEIDRKKDIVNKWKEEKEKIRQANEERLKNYLAAKKEKKERQMQERNMLMKIDVANYKERKILEKKNDNIQNLNEKPVVCKDMIKAFR